MITTRRECKRLFGTDLANLVLFNFSSSGQADPAQRRRHEQAVIAEMARRMGLGEEAEQPALGASEFSFSYFLRKGIGYVTLSARQLKVLIEQDFRRGILWLVFAAAIALMIAALGVANGMMANITSRRRQIAILRAVGMTRWQVVRMVLGEAICLGLIGSLMGVALGLYMAAVSNHLDYRLFGFEPILQIPWGWIAVGIVLTIGACLAAGLVPTASAARGNVVEALRST
jgi:predicted lysophospholipase L1 biosynthesis ABC-type transport system permease subunit